MIRGEDKMKQSRRNFLKGAIGAACGAALISCDERKGSKPILQETLVGDNATLQDFPYMMSKNGVFNAYIIVGDFAPASDVIAATDITNGIRDAELTTEFDNSQLASEITELDKHAIVIGRPYDNPLIRPGDVPALAYGEGYLRLEKENGLYRLIVSGADSLDIRKAGRVLAEHCSDSNKYDLKGKKATVQGTSLTDLAVQLRE